MVPPRFSVKFHSARAYVLLRLTATILLLRSVLGPILIRDCLSGVSREVYLAVDDVVGIAFLENLPTLFDDVVEIFLRDRLLDLATDEGLKIVTVWIEPLFVQHVFYRDEKLIEIKYVVKLGRYKV